MRPAVIILVVVGVLILAGYVFVGVEVARRAMAPREAEPSVATTEPARRVSLDLPEGSRIVGMVSTADRVVLHVTQPDATDRIYVLDPKSLTVTGGSAVGSKK